MFYGIGMPCQTIHKEIQSSITYYINDEIQAYIYIYMGDGLSTQKSFPAKIVIYFFALSKSDRVPLYSLKIRWKSYDSTQITMS